MSDKNKHVTPPAIFMLEEKIHEQQKEIDELKESLRLAYEALGLFEDHSEFCLIFFNDKKSCDCGFEASAQLIKQLEEKHEFLKEGKE